jgi:hypothetical protein
MPNNDQRQAMKERIIVILAVIFCVFILVYTDYGSSQRVYDCRISEISPDFPPEIKEECRRLQREHRREHQKDTGQYII